MIITLIGYRGCGKSSVGPLLAKHLGWNCIDSDDEIERVAEKSIAEIFAEDGEACFRQIESDVLGRLVKQQKIIIAAGGGAILAKANRDRMKLAGPVVWLQAKATTLAARISNDESSSARRPTLTGKSIEDEVSEVLNARKSAYTDAATMIVDADNNSPAHIAEEIVKQLGPDFGVPA